MPTPPHPDTVADDPVAEVVAFFNATCGTSYRPDSKVTRQLISARLHEGYTVDDCKTVILRKHAEWKNNPKMVIYLRPKTLFAPSNFESYLNQPDPSPRASNPYFAMLEETCHDTSRNPFTLGGHQDGLP